MASGCIVGLCPICKGWVYEDEVASPYQIVHEKCYMRGESKEKRIERLKALISEIEEED